MKTPPVVHGSFTIERTFQAPPARVFAAWADVETKARWFIGPPDKWTLVKRALDFRVGGQELLHGQLTGGPATIFTARYHVIQPNERLVYDYNMHVGDKHLSVSLATVELSPTKNGGTRMTFTEQAAFLDGEDGTKSRQVGTDAHFDRLSTTLDDPSELVSSRLLDAPRELVFQAFSDPDRLAQWWGPKGFRSTFREFDLRPGGNWRFVMHGPDGKGYENDNSFVEVARPERIVIRHVEPMHTFTMAITLVEVGQKTLLTWRMRFEPAEAAERVRHVVPEANEQNFDRLEAQLAAMAR